MNNILISHRGAIGDFILTWPALHSLKRLLPDFSVIGVGRSDPMRLAVKMNLIEDYYDAEGNDMTSFFNGDRLPFGMAPPAGAVLWLTEADKLGQLLTRTATLPIAIIKPFAQKRVHTAIHHLRSLRSFYPITVMKKAGSFCRSLRADKGNFALIHPGSGGKKKIFKASLYFDIARLLRRNGFHRVMFVLGPVEVEQGMGNTYAKEDCIKPRDLCELAEHLSQARLYIGNDSGASHLSGILGVPTLAFFRSTDPAIWGTLGPKTNNILARNEKEALDEVKKYLHRHA